MSILAVCIGLGALAMIAAIWWWVDHIADDELRAMGDDTTHGDWP